MNVSTLILKLTDNEKATFTVAGDGPYICYIMGPGTFYLTGLSALSNKITLVCCDGLWARHKTDPIDEKAIADTTLESIMQREKLIIQKIKEHFKCTKIGLLGFSAPAALAFNYALQNPDDIACVVGTGAGLCELDPTFSATDKLFNIKASVERIKKFDVARSNYEQIVKGEEKANPLLTDNFEMVNDKRRLTPNSDYLEQVRFLAAKLFYHEKHESFGFIHWHCNPHGQVVCQPMRMHFFNNIQPKLDTLGLLSALENKSKVSVLLVHGENDFITPLDEKTRELLKSYKQVLLITYPECGHMVYVEKSETYVKDISQFITKHTPMKRKSAQTVLLSSQQAAAAATQADNDRKSVPTESTLAFSQ